MTARCVLLTQDPFRGRPFGLPGNGDLYEWLDGLLRVPFERAGWSVRMLAPVEAGGALETDALAVSLGLPPDADGWAALHAGRVDGLDAIVDGLLSGVDLLAGFELPPYLVQGAARAGIPFLSLGPSSFRCLPDLPASIHTSLPELRERLLGFDRDHAALLPEAAIFAAGRRRRLRAPLFMRGRIGVFAGQMALDATRVVDGRLVAVDEHLDTIRAVAATLDHLLICPHPYEPDTKPLERLADALPNAMLTRLPFYDLLLSPRVTDVIALSSSALEEAVLFGKAAHRLIRCDRDRALEAHAGAPVTCGLGEFLFALLAALENGPVATFPVTTGGGFRASLGTGWGLDRLDLPPLLLPGGTVSDLGGACAPDQWHPPDGFCSWSCVEDASLMLRTAGASGRGLTLVLQANPAPEEQTVTVRFGSGARVSRRLDPSCTATITHALRDADLIGGGLLPLWIETGRPASPTALGAGNDDRLLGAGLVSIALV